MWPRLSHKTLVHSHGVDDGGRDWGETVPEVCLSLLSLFGVKFLLTAISITLPVPCGLYAPVFVCGCALGRLFGPPRAPSPPPLPPAPPPEALRELSASLPRSPPKVSELFFVFARGCRTSCRACKTRDVFEQSAAPLAHARHAELFTPRGSRVWQATVCAPCSRKAWPSAPS